MRKFYKISLLKAYINLAEGDTSIAHLQNLLSDKVKLNNLMINQALRWNIILKLNALGIKNSQLLVDAERKKDLSTSAYNNALAAQATCPDFHSKWNWLQKILYDNKLTLGEKRVVMANLFPPNQLDIKIKMLPEIYKAFTVANQNDSQAFIREFAKSINPNVCDTKNITTLETYINTHKQQLHPIMLKALKSSLDNEKRCIRIKDKIK